MNFLVFAYLADVDCLEVILKYRRVVRSSEISTKIVINFSQYIICLAYGCATEKLLYLCFHLYYIYLQNKIFFYKLLNKIE